MKREKNDAITFRLFQNVNQSRMWAQQSDASDPYWDDSLIKKNANSQKLFATDDSDPIGVSRKNKNF